MSKVLLPKEIFSKLKEKIIGQDDMLKELSVLGFLHLARMQSGQEFRKKETALVMGDSGTGKTYSIKALAETLNVPFVTFNADEISPAGWHGADSADLIMDVAKQENSQYTIVFIDEFDKIVMDKGDNNRAHMKRSQATLLKLIEGGVVHGTGGTPGRSERISLDTSKMLIILGGAFTHLREERAKRKDARSIGFHDKDTLEESISIRSELEKAGVLKEIIGRIVTVIETKPLSAEMLKKIVLSPYGLLAEYEEFLPEFNLRQFEFSPKDFKDLKKRMDSLDIGGRAVDTFVFDKLKELVFEHAQHLTETKE